MAETLSFFLVDDDEDVIALMTALLESRGHRVEASLAGTDALPKIAASLPDWVLTDLMMAELDGLQFCAELRKNRRLAKTGVVFVSARADSYWQKRAEAAGATGYIVKPIDAETFIDTLETITSAAPGRQD